MNLFSQQDTNKSNYSLHLMVTTFILFVVRTGLAETSTMNTLDSRKAMTITAFEKSTTIKEHVSANSTMNFVHWYNGSKTPL